MLLHSRGGPTGGRPARNTEYEKALATIIRRLRAPSQPTPVIERVLIDSELARKVPPDDRVLVNGGELSGLSDSEVITLIRRRARIWGQAPGVNGGNSTKALRIETIGRSHESIRSTLVLMDWVDKKVVYPADRLSNGDQRKVTALHIRRAVARLRAGEDAPNFAASRDYDVLLDDGTRLAPKKVFGLALEDALGFETFPGHFSAGWSVPCFQIIEAAGYSIVLKSSAEAAAEALKQLTPSPEDVSLIEGNVKVAVHLARERAPGLAAKKKRQFVQDNGYLYCERCKCDPADVYGVEFGYACIEVHHAATQVKDMKTGHQTKLSDLQCLCANCHRITHKELAASTGRNANPPPPQKGS